MNNDRFRFRAWDNGNKKMYYDGVLIGLDGELSFTDPIRGTKYNPFDFMIMQATGLHDQNGKPIFEGDILRSIGDRDVVIFVVQWGFRDNKYAWGVRSVNTAASYEFGDYCGTRMEVIGNIHEHPELIKVNGKG